MVLRLLQWSFPLVCYSQELEQGIEVSADDKGASKDDSMALKSTDVTVKTTTDSLGSSRTSVSPSEIYTESHV